MFYPNQFINIRMHDVTVVVAAAAVVVVDAVSSSSSSLFSERPIDAPIHLSAVSPRCQRLSVWTQIVPDLGRWNVGRFHSLLLFLQANNAVMLRDQTVSQASKHLCPPTLQTRRDFCCACQSAFPVHSPQLWHGLAVYLQKSLQLKTVHRCVSVTAAHLRLHLLQQVQWVCDNDGLSNLCVTLGGQPLYCVYACLYPSQT